MCFRWLRLHRGCVSVEDKRRLLMFLEYAQQSALFVFSKLVRIGISPPPGNLFSGCGVIFADVYHATSVSRRTPHHLMISMTRSSIRFPSATKSRSRASGIPGMPLGKVWLRLLCRVTEKDEHDGLIMTADVFWIKRSLRSRLRFCCSREQRFGTAGPIP